MKKLTILIICIAMLFSFVGCSHDKLKTGEESTVVEGTAFDVAMDIIEGTVKNGEC